MTVPRRGIRFIALCEIVNFQMLRRHVGLPRADALTFDLADRIGHAHAGLRSVSAGRALLQISFESDDMATGEGVVAALRETLSDPFDIDGEWHDIDVLFGAAAMAGDDHDEVRLVEGAENALRDARTACVDVVRDLTTEQGALDSLSLMRELPGAIRSGEMFMQYQPKVHVRRQEVASVEALVRWNHPRHGLILPGDFIPVAEQAGLIGALTIWTLDRVIADQRVLASDGHILPIFINISGVLLADRHFVDRACAIVRESGAKLGFEITETAVIRDPDTAIEHLRMFAELGIAIAIDDYGAGLSSLAYLKRLPASELKIDKMFVMQLTSSNRDPLIVRSTIDLAHALDMEVTAEGVETPAALALLSVMGCDMVQGYLLGRPVGLAAFRQYLADERHLGAVAAGRPSFDRPETFWKRA